MPEGVGYGPQDTVSIGKTLNIIGTRCYAYSGVIADAASGSASKTMVKFMSGNYVAVVECFVADNDSGDYNRFYTASMNGVIIYATKFDNSNYQGNTGGPMVVFVIPPYTEFEFKWGSSGSFEAILSLVGRIHGKID